MKIIRLLIAISLFAFLNSCGPDLELLEKTLTSKIKEDGPSIAHLESVYSLVFINERDNLIASNDLYVRRDKASIYYGYDIQDIDIMILEENEKRILKVKLPTPKKVSTDRKIVSHFYTHDTYTPVGANNKPIDVDMSINRNLNRLSKQYEEKSLEMTRKISSMYFENLAKRFGLELKLEFS
jgi:hypothetical protein